MISTNGNAGDAWGFEQGFGQFVEDLPFRSYPEDEGRGVPAEEVTARALQLIDEFADEEPFFLFLHYTDPHDPYFEHPGLLPEAEPPGRFGGSRADLRRLRRVEPTEDDKAHSLCG